MAGRIVTRRTSVYTVRVRRRTAWSRIAAAIPPSMTGRAGSHCSPIARQLNEPQPGVGGRPLFQPGHPRIDQPLLVTPEGDEDDIPLTGQASRQCHLASAEVTGRQPRERHPFII